MKPKPKGLFQPLIPPTKNSQKNLQYSNSGALTIGYALKQGVPILGNTNFSVLSTVWRKTLFLDSVCSTGREREGKRLGTLALKDCRQTINYLKYKEIISTNKSEILYKVPPSVFLLFNNRYFKLEASSFLLETSAVIDYSSRSLFKLKKIIFRL